MGNLIFSKDLNPVGADSESLVIIRAHPIVLSLMAFRFFRRFRIAPGVTVNLTKRGGSLSFGPRGAKLTAGTSGVRRTLSVPGTGLWYTEHVGRKSSGGKSRARKGAAAAPPAPTVRAQDRLTYLEVDQVSEVNEWPDFDLVAISTFTAQAYEAYAVADRYRQAGTTVIMGGLHVTVEPEEAFGHADAVVIGEGELCWQEVLRDAESGTLRSIYRAAPREFDLADAPMPAYELLDMERYNRVTVQTTRGCPLRCSFCASSILLTRRYKHKPIAKVLREIDRIRELWPRPFLEFADDNSFVEKRYWKQLLPKLEKRRVRWFTETDISVGEDEELLGMLRRAGCKEVLIGLESPVAEGLAGLERRYCFTAPPCRSVLQPDFTTGLTSFLDNFCVP